MVSGKALRSGHPIPSIEGPATFSSREEPPMTSHPSPRPVSTLRVRMIEDMRVRGFAEKTRNDYVRNVRAFAAFIGRSPDTATAEDLRRFQLHQTQTGMQPPSINSAVAALRVFFTVTLDRSDLARRLTISSAAPTPPRRSRPFGAHRLALCKSRVRGYQHTSCHGRVFR